MELKLRPAAAFHLFKSANMQNALINSQKILILLLLLFFFKKLLRLPPSKQFAMQFEEYIKTLHIFLSI